MTGSPVHAGAEGVPTLDCRLSHGRWSEDFRGLPGSLVEMKVFVVAAKQGGTPLSEKDPRGLRTVVLLTSWPLSWSPRP